jgi:hypothetical protein
MNRSLKPAFILRSRDTLGAAAVFALAALLVLVLSGCDLGGDPSYYVSFTLDGTDYELTSGYTDNNVFDPGANGAKSDSSDRILIGAAKSTVSDMDKEGPFIYLRFNGMTPGVYGGGECSISIASDGATEYFADSDLTVILDYCSEVGGAIEGTFSGQVKEGIAGPTVSLENGYFYVERMGDGSVSPPDRFK